MSTGPTLQRLERVLLMVPWLLDNPGVTVEEVAQRFDVPPREVVRDLDILGYCGLPGYGGGDLVEASIVGDRISIGMAEFFRRPLSLSLHEALTLLLAGSALASVEGLSESAALASAVAKLRSALGADAQLAIDLRTPGDAFLEPLRAAVRERRVVRLVYRSASKAETTERLVEPWAVVGSGGAWYLHGWCRQADGARHFRLDRIREVALTDQITEARASAPAAPVYTPEADDQVVVLDLDEGAAWLADEVAAESVVPSRGGQRVTFRTSSLEWVARLLLRLGGQARVVEPAALRERVAELGRAAQIHYS